MSEHGVTHGIATSDQYRLGWVGKPLADDVGRHEGCLSIPYLTEGGVKAIKFRRLGDREHKSKYIQHSGQRSRLYNTMQIDGAVNVIGLTEGEIDAIVATERLGVPTVGFPGVDTWHHNVEIWAPIFKDFETVLIFADGDRTGREVANSIRATIGWGAHVIDCPDKEDVSSMVAAGRGEELEEKVKRVMDGEG